MHIIVEFDLNLLNVMISGEKNVCCLSYFTNTNKNLEKKIKIAQTLGASKRARSTVYMGADVFGLNIVSN